jgi:hypothetical protein
MTDCLKCGGKDTIITANARTKNDIPFSWKECTKCGFTYWDCSGFWIPQGDKRCFFEIGQISLCRKLMDYNPRLLFEQGGDDWYRPVPHWLLIHPDNCPECFEKLIERYNKSLSSIGGLHNFLWEYLPLPKRCGELCDRYTRRVDYHKERSCEGCAFYVGGRNMVCLIRKTQGLINKLFESETEESKKNWDIARKWEKEQNE